MPANPPIHKLPKRLLPIKNTRLSGAACAGKSPTFDLGIAGELPEDQAARHSYAKLLCRYCKVSRACKETAAGLKPSERQGVWAGTVYGADGKPTQSSLFDRQKTA